MKYGKTKTFAKIADGKPSKNSAGVDFSQTSLYIYPRIATIPATVGIGLAARTCIRGGVHQPSC